MRLRPLFTASATHALLLFLLAAPAAASFAPEEVSLASDSLFHAGHYEQHFERHVVKRATVSTASGWAGETTLAAAGVSGVSAMQISVVDNDHILIFDKSEDNPLRTRGHAAWGAIYTISTQAVRPLNLLTNSFCAGGGWLSNGTLVSLGGNGVEDFYADDTAQNGTQSIRLFTPCTNNKCDVYESPKRIRLTSPRWYPSSTRLEDGSLLVMGGMLLGGFNNFLANDNPTFEFFPPKGDGLQFRSQFLHDALNTNLFPIMFYLPNGQIFVAANRLAMIYDWKKNKERRLPNIPNGVRINYPASAASALLPLTIANKFTPTVLICGGTTANTDVSSSKLSSQYPAASQCVSMTLTTAGIKAGWSIEQLPERRVMGDAVLTPDGKIFIVNGAGSGVAGYDNVPDRIGHSNADHPVYRPCLYDPLAKKGKRFTTNFPSSKIERLYHSSASLIPDGRIVIMGSNPNHGVMKKKYQTRYNVEMFSPPYIASKARPVITIDKLPSHIEYGGRYRIVVKTPKGARKVTAVLMDLGYSTHGVHMNNRLVELAVSKLTTASLYITAPGYAGLYPPGYAWIYILADGIPSKGYRLMVGDGSGPPVSQSAIENMLKKTKKTGA